MKSIEQTTRTLCIVLIALFILRCLVVAIFGWLYVIWPLLAIIGLFLLVMSLIDLMTGLIRLGKAREWRRFAGIIAGMVLVVALPWASLYEDMRFWLLRPQMEAAAEQVIEQISQQRPTYSKITPLPRGQKHLSRLAGQVEYYAQDNVVFFYTEAVRGRVAGYLYFPSGSRSIRPDATDGVLYDYYYGLGDWENKGAQWEYCAYS